MHPDVSVRLAQPGLIGFRIPADSSTCLVADMRSFVNCTAPVEGVNDTTLEDTSQTVSAEELSALGHKVFTLRTDFESEEKFKTLATSRGYPERDALQSDR
ncbi:hypothetical protein Moror_13586 [Moniliophthora roreri MCA 2997]|uniref:Uncharacterized protein n=1 Tax=Moniliophthora roreri (strain MCA 2997) TaxID=1381753 RepID=V2YFN5_MONRO|nr:hypothetical protein Moror_13586 [Moniliophthora roreri MCA 2997]